MFRAVVDASKRHAENFQSLCGRLYKNVCSESAKWMLCKCIDADDFDSAYQYIVPGVNEEPSPILGRVLKKMLQSKSRQQWQPVAIEIIRLQESLNFIDDNDGETYVKFAARQNWPLVVVELVNNGADPNLDCHPNALTIVQELDMGKDIEKLMLSRGARDGN